ncbi:hypothetical protein J437_LFUL004781 [Ladona fulva]|uniref:Sulfotransferase domain-containing protein n=1 Tax=Ladona fulva TaxID=123851 RepID=A0A8K0K0X4_LADFU|nr:hypothetical protein J437_LFUL004781 [Ladona fulva]
MEEKSESDPNAADFVERMSKPGYEAAAAMESPRHIRTHLPLSLLPPNLLDTCKPNVSEEKLKRERGFFGKGESGTWRNEFTKELNEKADEWIEEHEKMTDLRFQF